MPSGNSLVVFLIIDSACFGFIKPVVRFFNKSSREMPSIKSIGSRTLPFDLLIFWPSASRINPWTYTCLKGIRFVTYFVIITIRATQKKIISKPVTRTEEGKYLSKAELDCSGYSGVQSNVENGHSAEENQVSNTSSSLLSSPV